MNLLHRYIFKSLLAASLLAVGIFAFLLIVGNVLKDVIGLLTDGQLSFPLFFRLLSLLVPYVIAYALPLGILTGVLLVLGRLSAQREITAMRSAGISLLQISAPVFFLGVLGVAFSVTINFYYAPNARAQYREDLSQSIRENPLNYLVQGRFVRDFPGYVIYVGEKRENELRDLWLWELGEGRMVSRFLHAEEAVLDYEEATESILLILREVYAEIRSESDLEDLREGRPAPSIQQTAIRLPLRDILGGRARSKRLGDMTFNEIVTARREHQATEPGADHFAQLIRIQLSIQERFAMAFSVLSLALLAVPLGIRIQRKETSSNLVIALCLAMVFYFLVIAVGWFETRPGLRPDILVWFPNLLFQAVGIWMFLRIERL
jgi:lipopolysaccharide export system permease protein